MYSNEKEIAAETAKYDEKTAEAILLRLTSKANRNVEEKSTVSTAELKENADAAKLKATNNEPQPEETTTLEDKTPAQHSMHDENGYYVHNGSAYNSLTKDGLWVGGTDGSSGFHVDKDGNVTTTGTAQFKQGASMGGNKITDVADGKIEKGSTDAVNGGQLAAYVAGELNYTGEGAVSVKDRTISVNTGEGLTVDEDELTLALKENGNLAFDTDGNLILKDSITVADANIGSITINGDNGQSIITGLSNTTWTGDNINDNRAATEGQLQDVAQIAADALTEADKHTVVSLKDGETNLEVKNTANENEAANYEISLKKDLNIDSANITGKISAANAAITNELTAGAINIDSVTIDNNTITGLSNTAWTGDNIVNDRAATEGQLKQALENLDLNDISMTVDGEERSLQSAGIIPGSTEKSDQTYAKEAIAIGHSATATGDYSTALGYDTIASENYSTALGNSAQATGESSTALGHQAKASGEFSSAVGYYAKALGDYSTALGYYANASGESGIALGYRAEAKDYSSALGYQANASGGSSTALGREATANGDYSTALGYGVTTDGYSSIALGRETTTEGDYSIALGREAATEGYSSIALGREAIADGEYSIALGREATTATEGRYSIALGREAKANGDYSTALGNGAQATGESSTALGRQANASGVSSTALGYLAQATGESSAALGHRATASGVSSMALGHQAKATGDYSTALGYLANASAQYSIAVGNNASATEYSGIAVGTGASASGDTSVALGNTARAFASYSIALGYETTVSEDGDEGTSFGI